MEAVPAQHPPLSRYLESLTSWSSDAKPSSFRIMKGFFFPSLLFLIFSSAARAPEEGVTMALAAEAAVVERAASSVGSMAVKPTVDNVRECWRNVGRSI